jgi:hypothetical protein
LLFTLGSAFLAAATAQAQSPPDLSGVWNMRNNAATTLGSTFMSTHSHFILWFLENSAGSEIIALVGVGFSGNVRDLAFIPAILSRVLPTAGRSSGGGPRLATPDHCSSIGTGV